MVYASTVNTLLLFLGLFINGEALNAKQDSDNFFQHIARSKAIEALATDAKGSRNLQQCGSLLSSVESQVSDMGAQCSCSSTVSVTCSYNKTCVVPGEVCADEVDVTIDIANGVSVRYCSKFSDPPFDDTCIIVTMSDSGRSIGECKQATYGYQKCACTVCDDRTSLDIDCSSYEANAFTQKCQEMDLVSSDLLPFVPAFQYFIPTTSPTKHPTQSPTEIPLTESLTTILPEPEYDEQEIIDESIPIAEDSISLVEIPEDKSCKPFVLLAEEIEDADDICGCETENRIDCYFQDICSDAGLCASLVTLGLDLTSGISSEYCTDFVRADFERTCVNTAIGYDQKFISCEGATFGGKPCRCEVCDDKLSLVVDCSDYNADATTNGCQIYPGEVGPVIPAFQGSVTSDGFKENSDGLNVRNDDPDDACPLFEILSGVLGDMKCGCGEGNILDCRKLNVCTGSTCADSVDMMISIQENIEVEYSVTFVDKKFELTNVMLAVTMGLQNSLKLDECQGATYGGKNCVCKVCNDRKSLDIDCSAHDSTAVTDGCEEIDLSKLSAYVPGFGSTTSSENGQSVASFFTVSCHKVWSLSALFFFGMYIW